MNEFQQQILQKIEQIALKLENYKTNNIELTKSKEELEAKVNYLERREQELKNQLEQKQMELSEKSELIDKATNKIEDLLGSIDIDA
jgi:chromosome segregation ATPase|tara:strand:+ start:512 stop:772 length:261 start_codon:yes stop_codon:yes gene_type:complete